MWRLARYCRPLPSPPYLDPSVLGPYPEEQWRFCLSMIYCQIIQWGGWNHVSPWTSLESLPQPCGLWHCLQSIRTVHSCQSIYEPYVMPGRKINPHRGWEIYEQGICDIAFKISKKIMAISNGCWRKMEWESKMKKDSVKMAYPRWLSHGSLLKAPLCHSRRGQLCTG